MPKIKIGNILLLASASISFSLKELERSPKMIMLNTAIIPPSPPFHDFPIVPEMHSTPVKTNVQGTLSILLKLD